MLPIVLIIFVAPFYFTAEKIPLAFETNKIGFAIGLAILQFLSLIAQPEGFQRIFAVKNTRVLKKSLKWAFVMLMLVAGSVAYVGINFKFGGTAIDPSGIFVDGVLKALPHWLGSLLSVSLIAAFMGTIDSSAFALGSLLSAIRHTPSQRAIRQIRLFTILGIIVSAIASLYLFSFLASVFALVSLISVVGAVLLVSLIVKLRSIEINVFLIAGIVTFILGLLFKFVTDNPLTSLVPSAVGLGAFVLIRIGSFCKKGYRLRKQK
jgi:hypothetical protein